MTNLLLYFVALATVISTIVSFIKPGYEGLVKKKYISTISIGIAFILGIVAAFSFDLGLELTTGAKILAGLAMGTGSTIWYDLWEILKSIENRLNNFKKE